MTLDSNGHEIDKENLILQIILRLSAPSLLTVFINIPGLRKYIITIPYGMKEQIN